MTIETLCPVVRTEMLALMHRIDTDGLGTREFATFTKEISWLRESEAQIIYRHNGKLLKEGTTFNDFYGFLTSMKAAVEDAQKSCDHFGVTRESTLEIAVQVRVHEIPVLPAVDAKSVFRGRRTYQRAPERWLLHDPAKLEAYRAATTIEERLAVGLRSLESRTFAEDVVWSSLNSAEANASLMNAFRVRVTPAPLSGRDEV